jgi:aspartyl protease family protein
MRSVLIIFCLVSALGIVAVQRLDKKNQAGDAVLMSASAKQTPQSGGTASGRTVTLQSDRRGHFQVDARVDGRAVDFMVDTGASVIALTESSAAKVGIRPLRSDYTSPVSTANGVVKGARTRLASVDIGGLEVRDVEAMVLPDNVLSENLLGLSYLSRLRRFEYANGKLVLEQ